MEKLGYELITLSVGVFVNVLDAGNFTDHTAVSVNHALWPACCAARMHTDGFVVVAELDLDVICREAGDQIVKNGYFVGFVKVNENFVGVSRV